MLDSHVLINNEKIHFRYQKMNMKKAYKFMKIRLICYDLCADEKDTMLLTISCY